MGTIGENCEMICELLVAVWWYWNGWIGLDRDGIGDYNKWVVVDRLDTIFVHGRLVPRSGGNPALKGGNDDATEAEDGNGGQSRMGL